MDLLIQNPSHFIHAAKRSYAARPLMVSNRQAPGTSHANPDHECSEKFFCPSKQGLNLVKLCHIYI